MIDSETIDSTGEVFEDSREEKGHVLAQEKKRDC